MRPRAAGAAALAAVLTLGACGTTFVDETIATIDTSPDATTTTVARVAEDAPLDELLIDIETLMFDLDQIIVDDDLQALEVYARIDELWTVAEPSMRCTTGSAIGTVPGHWRP